MSLQGTRALVANYAATSGRVPNAPAEAPVGARGRRYRLAQHRVTTLEVGPAEGFDHRDLVPLLQAVERRLGTFR